MYIENLIKEINVKFSLEENNEQSDKSNCPPDEILAKFLENSLEEKTKETVLTHIIECSSCLRTLYELKGAVQEPIKTNFIEILRYYYLNLLDFYSLKWIKTGSLVFVSFIILILFIYPYLSPIEGNFVFIEDKGDKLKIVNIERGWKKEKIKEEKKEENSTIHIEVSLREEGYLYLLFTSQEGVTLYNSELYLLNSSLPPPPIITPLSKGKHYIPDFKSDKRFPNKIIKEGEIYLLFTDSPLKNIEEIDFTLKSLFNDSKKNNKRFQKELKNWGSKNNIKVEKVKI